MISLAALAESGASVDHIISSEMSHPRPLQSTTLRRLPLMDVIDRVRRFVRTPAADWPPASVLEAGENAGEAHDAWLAKRQAAWTPRKRRDGRVTKYSRDELGRVAAIYTEACGSGSSSPTKDVAEALGIPRNTAAKLVMKCRLAGLLGPAPADRTAGGILEDPQSSDQPRQRSTNDQGGSHAETT
jgi:hypothetical protein